MECDGESQGGKLEAMPGTKGDGARSPDFPIDLIEERMEFVILEDGYTYYCPNGGGGLTAHNLRQIAEELDRRNAPVDELYRREFRNDARGRD